MESREIIDILPKILKPLSARLDQKWKLHIYGNFEGYSQPADSGQWLCHRHLLLLICNHALQCHAWAMYVVFSVAKKGLVLLYIPQGHLSTCLQGLPYNGAWEEIWTNLSMWVWIQIQFNLFFFFLAPSIMLSSEATAWMKPSPLSRGSSSLGRGQGRQTDDKQGNKWAQRVSWQ